MAQKTRNFDKEAAVWDEKPGRVQLAQDSARAIKDRGRLSADMDVLDFGCGTGLLTLALQPLVRSITGADASNGMLEVLARKIQQGGLSNVTTLPLDPEEGRGLSGSYHLITSSMTLHHLRNLDTLLRRFHDILKPSGMVALADLDPDDGQFHTDNAGVFHPGFDRSDFRKSLARAGFINIQITDAARVEKPLPDGSTRLFSVFLATAQKNPAASSP